MGLSWDSPIDWQRFDEYVCRSFATNTLRDYRRYAPHYSDVLTMGDASPLLSLSDAKRRHVLASLAALSNFLGAKERWKHIVSEYWLKWTSKNNLGDLVGLSDSNRFDDMISELKTVLETVPEDYGNYYRFNVLTGLRPSEAVRALNMLRTSRREYLNLEMGVLEHFRYTQNFIRNTKKTFISVVDDETLIL